MYDSNKKHQELSNAKSIVFSAFDQMEQQLDCRIPKSFYLILVIFLSINGKINFLQLERFSEKCEQSFRYFFEQSFDFFSFNSSLIQQNVKGKMALAFDPSYISKSGKKTDGVNYFWSGVAGKSKWGLELCGLAVLDLTRKTAFHLNGFQTIDVEEDETLLNFYMRKILEKKEELLGLSNYLVSDAYFSKKSFVNGLLAAGFQTVSRLRDDADMRYIFKGVQKRGKGRNKQYDGKINFKKLNAKYAKLVSSKDNEKIYSLIANHKTLKRAINLVIVYRKNDKNEWKHKLYLSTDLKQDWKEILEMYRLRFQIEFLYRDAKQHTGLNDCQARSKNKLNFHWNMSLTTINVAKIAHWITIQDKKTKEAVPFSMVNIKTQYNNELLVNRFIAMFGINTRLNRNKTKIKQFLSFGKISA